MSHPHTAKSVQQDENDGHDHFGIGLKRAYPQTKPTTHPPDPSRLACKHFESD